MSATRTGIVAEAAIRLSDIGLPEPGVAENWHANLIHAWTRSAWTRVAGGGVAVEALGELRFDRDGLAVRANKVMAHNEGRVSAVLGISAGRVKRDLVADAQIQGGFGNCRTQKRQSGNCTHLLSRAHPLPT